MNILFIISASIAIKKCNEILIKLTSNGIHIDCILTENAKKMIKKNDLKKIIKDKIFRNKF